jgi:hypothetical protein
MRYSKLTTVAAIAGALAAQTVLAAPTADEAAQLGKTLTPMGAIKAGNADGSIPEWTGGLCTSPASYKPFKGAAGGAPYVDPFPTDKPIFKITAADVAKYADKLDDGTKELFRRFPQTFHLDVYQTKRTACYPNWVYENTIKNVMKPKIVGGNVPALEGAHAQVPFPIPKSGVEVMWNVITKMEQPFTQFDIDTYLVDSSGSVIQTALQTVYNQNLYWDNGRTSVPVDKPYWSLIAKVTAPASQVGSMQMRHQYLRPDLKGSPAYSYIPGQRRVRLAPEFTYDGVATTSGGVMLYDEINSFDGKMDKYDFKLTGREEMYVTYNAYKYYLSPAKAVMGPKHLNPDSLRWELHRVWKVEATLKPGERHVHKKKVFYVDEDSWNIMTYYGIDQADKVHHLQYAVAIQMYDRPELRNQSTTLYDFAKSAYLFQNKVEGEGFLGQLPGNIKVPPYHANFFTPDSMAAMGMR